MWWHDTWCRKRLEWWQQLFFYHKCNCPKGKCLPAGPGGPVEER